MTRTEALERLAMALEQYLWWESHIKPRGNMIQDWQTVKDTYAALARAEPNWREAIQEADRMFSTRPYTIGYPDHTAWLKLPAVQAALWEGMHD